MHPPRRTTRQLASLRVQQLETRVTPASISDSAIVIGTDAGVVGEVRVLDQSGTVVSSFQPYSTTFTGGVRVAVGDVTRDGVSDIVTAPGPGTTATIKAFDGTTLGEIFRFEAFESDFTGGAFVALGDFDDDGRSDVVVSPDESGGPRIRVISGADQSQISNFFGIDDLKFRGGARVGVGDLNGDGNLDLIVGAGFSGGPRVSIFDGSTIVAGRTPTNLFPDFFIFEEGLRNGSYLASADLNGDGVDDLIAGAGPGGAPRVLVLDGLQMTLNGVLNPKSLASFYAGDKDNRSGVRVGSALSGDGQWQLLASPGSGGGGLSGVYDTNGSALSQFVMDGTNGGFISADLGVAPGRSEIVAARNGTSTDALMLGIPTTKIRQTEDGSIQQYQNGAIVWTVDSGALVIAGNAYDAWLANGFLTIGFPRRLGRSTDGGFVLNFDGLSITRTGSGETVRLEGEVDRVWREGGADQAYGLPIGNAEGGDLPGSLVYRFQNGVILSSPSLGTTGVVNPGTNYSSPFFFPSAASATGGDGYSLTTLRPDRRIPETTYEDYFRAYRPQIIEVTTSPFVDQFATSAAAAYVAAAETQRSRFPIFVPIPRDVQAFLKAEFGNVFSDELIRGISLHYGAVPLDVFNKGGSEGQTFGTDIYIKAPQGTMPLKDQIVLIAHEMMHTLQFQSYGSSLYNFGYNYMRSYALAGFRYNDIQQEKEAFEFQGVVGRRYDERLALPQQGSNRQVRINNNTGENITLFTRYHSSPVGTFFTDATFWAPRDGSWLVYNIPPGLSGSLSDQDGIIEADYLRISAVSPSGRRWDRYSFTDYIVYDDFNVHTIEFNRIP